MSQYDPYLNVFAREPTKNDLIRTAAQPPKRMTDKSEIEKSSLAESEIDQLVGRLPEIEEKDSDCTFFRREKSLPPPKPGGVILSSFPPKDAPKGTGEHLGDDKEDLEVIRSVPGDSGVHSNLPYISLTFSHPMIVLGTIDQIEKQPIPCKIEPSVEGTYRWVGTKTITFRPKYRFIKSTKFRVVVPSGTKCAIEGKMLKKEFSMEFSTTPVRVVRMFPRWNQVVNLNPLIFIEFDQEIDIEKIFKKLSVKENRTHHILKLLKDKKSAFEYLSQHQVKEKYTSLFRQYRSYLRSATTGRFIVVALENSLKPNTHFTTVLEDNLPSKEGPLLSTKPHHSKFRTFPPLRYKSKYPNQDLSTYSWLNFYFSNPIDEKHFKKNSRKLVRFNPPIDQSSMTPQKINISSASIGIHGGFRGRTKYEITIDKSLKDIYSQTLGKDKVFKVTVGPASERLYSNQAGVITLMSPNYSVRVVNISTLRVIIAQVDPKEFHYSYFGSDRRGPSLLSASDPLTLMNAGKVVFDGNIDTNAPQDEDWEVVIPLGKYLQHSRDGLGQVIVYVEKKMFSNFLKFKDRPHVFSWVQVTRMGVDAVCGAGREINLMATKIEDGSGVSKGEFEVIRAKGPPAQARGLLGSIFEGWKSSDSSAKSYKKETLKIRGDENGYGRVKIRLPKYSKKEVEKFPYISSVSYNSIVVCRKGKDVCFVANVRVIEHKVGDGSVLSHVFCDRNLYKPNEEVTMKGYVRVLKIKSVKLGLEKEEEEEKKKEKKKYNREDVPLLSSCRRYLEIPTVGKKGIEYKVYDSRGNEFHKGKIEKLNAGGQFCVKFKIPDNANLGQGSVSFSIKNAGMDMMFYKSFKIQEFTVPEFTVEMRKIPADIRFVCGHSGMKKKKKEEGENREEEKDLDVCVVEAKAKYYSGEPLINARTNYVMKQSNSSFSPNIPDMYRKKGGFCFDDSIMIQNRGQVGYYGYGYNTMNPVHNYDVTYNKTTDLNGNHKLCLQFSEKMKPPSREKLFQFDAMKKKDEENEKEEEDVEDDEKKKKKTKEEEKKGKYEGIVLYDLDTYHPPISINVSGSVRDINYRKQSSALSLLVHRSSLMLGVRKDKYFIGPDEKLHLDFVVANADGLLIGNVPILVEILDLTALDLQENRSRAEPHRIKKSSKKDDDNPVLIERTILNSNASELVGVDFGFERGGRFVIRGTIVDEKGRIHRCATDISVVGPRGGLLSIPKAEGEKVAVGTIDLIANRKKYFVGGEKKEVAKILISAPPGYVGKIRGVVCYSQQGLIKMERFLIDEGEDRMIVYDVDIKKYHVPTLKINVMMRGKKKIDGVEGKFKPAFSVNSIDLSVVPLQCDVTITPKVKVLRPGDESSFVVQVNPNLPKEEVEAEESGKYSICAFIVDEAVLRLAGYEEFEDPLNTFFASGASSNAVGYTYFLSQVFLRHMKKKKMESKKDEDDEEEDDTEEEEDESDLELATDEIKAMMAENLDRIMDQSECLDTLNCQSERLSNQSLEFCRTAKKCQCGGGALGLGLAVAAAPFAAVGGLFATKKCKRCCRPCKKCCDLDMHTGKDCLSGDMGGEITGKGEVSKEKTPIELRKKFECLVVFCDMLETEGNSGKVTVPFTLPHNLTSYQIRVFALKMDDVEDEKKKKKTTKNVYYGNTIVGIGSSNLQVQLPFSIRPSLPRFLNFGDTALVCVVIQNQCNQDITVNVAIRTSDHFTILPSTTDGDDEYSDEPAKASGFQVKLTEEKNRYSLYFPIKADTKIGVGKFQVVGEIVSPKEMSHNDAVEKELRVFTPSTTECFALYGEIDSLFLMKKLAGSTASDVDEGEVENTLVQPIMKPTNVHLAYGGLDITLSSTIVQSICDAFIYLYKFEYDCLEQVSSRCLAISCVRKILEDFNVPNMPNKKEIKKCMKFCINKIGSCQKYDGGIGFWTILSPTNVFLTLHTCHCLLRIFQDGWEVKDQVWQRAKKFCTNVKGNLNSIWYIWVSKSTKYVLQAMGLYLCTLFYLEDKKYLEKKKKESKEEEEKDQTKKKSSRFAYVTEESLLNAKTRIESLGEELFKVSKKKLCLEGQAWLAFALFHVSSSGVKHPAVDHIMRFIRSNVNETPETATFITSYTDMKESQLLMLHSNRRTSAILVDLLMDLKPKSDLIPKIIKGLMKHKKGRVPGLSGGRWSSTSECAYCLIALKKYYEIYEKVVPDFSLDMWMGKELFAGKQVFKGRESVSKTIRLPMKDFVSEFERIKLKKAEEGEGDEEEDEGKKKKKKDVDDEEDELAEQENLYLVKKGQGRCYYRIGLDYAPINFDKTKGRNYGFFVQREIVGVTNAEHVKKKKEKDEKGDEYDRYIIKAGELVRVNVTMVNTSVRYHVALVCFLPAGLEILNPELKNTEPIPPDPEKEKMGRGAYGFSHRMDSWIEHQNLRDERAEAFCSYLRCGIHKYSFVCRAITKGNFVVPPVKAEEMYSPEVFGRSKCDLVTIQ